MDQIVVDGATLTSHTVEIKSVGDKIKLGELSIRNGVPVYDASFNLTIEPNAYGVYPEIVTVDVGDDGDNEYQYTGRGYGAMGLQTFLKDNSSELMFETKKAGADSTNSILLPKNAVVTSAELQITGELYEWGDRNVIDAREDFVGEVHPADLDGDGDNDVVIVAQSQVKWYNNTNGVGSAWTEHSINLSQSNAAVVFVSDIDADLDMDVVAVSRGTQYGSGPMVYYRNMDGKGRTWDSYVVNDTFYACYNLEIADMDNDGDGDIVASSNNNGAPRGVYWFNNTDGNGSSWEQEVIVENEFISRGLVVADIDGDGDNDTIIPMVMFPSYYDQIHWYENLDGNATSWNSHVIANVTGFAYMTALTSGDIDNDGKTDLVEQRAKGIYWLKQPTNPRSIWKKYIITHADGSYWSDITLADVGSSVLPPDGRLDIIGTGMLVDYTAALVCWKNDGTLTDWNDFGIAGYHPGLWSVKAAEMDQKNYIDLVVGGGLYGNWEQVSWYKINNSYPTNVELDIGYDGFNDWTYPTGYFNSTVSPPGLKDLFNSILPTGVVDNIDDFGNQFVGIDIKISTATGGKITIHDINIKYDLTVQVKGRTGRPLSDELNDLISPGSTGNTTIPIMVNASTGGKFTINDINIIYNEYPESSPISGYSLDEDEKNDFLIDLSSYFSDDYVNSHDLTYDVISYTNDPILNVFINDDQKHYLGLDSSTGINNDDWHGSTNVVVRATDDAGLETSSEPFVITVNPVNDEPVIGSKDIPDITINEGGISTGLDLDADEYFKDIDSPELFFDHIIDPLEEYEDEILMVTIVEPGKILRVDSSGDFYTKLGSSIRVRIYCDDDPTGINQSLVYQDIFITVTNLPDDPPQWLSIPTINIKEDIPKDDAINLNNYIHDIDNDVSDITFSIISVSHEQVHLTIDNQDNIDITMDDNFNGKVKVDVTASDGVNSNATSFEIDIEPVNDKPEVELTSPAYEAILPNGTVNLVWSGSDVDLGDGLNLTYTIYLDSINGTTVYETGYSSSNIVIDDLIDKTTYYWKVIPNDGIGNGSCISDPVPSKFTIDIGELPYCVLKLPANDAIIDSASTTLRWDGFAEEGYFINYDVYFSNASFEFPYPESIRIAEGIKDNHVRINGLELNKEYYWTVVPTNARGTGLCTSGIWTFTYDPTVISYNLEIEMPSSLRIKYGKPAQVSIRITNIGTNTDIIIPSLSSGLSGSLINFEGVTLEYTIEKDKELILVLNINADKIPVGDYDINVSISSLGSGENITRSISLEIYEEKESSQDMLFYVSSVLITIIVTLVIAMLMFIRHKRKQEEARRVDAELVTAIDAKGVLDAKEVKYLLGSGKEGAGKKDIDAELPGNEGTDVIDTGELEVPKLPPTEDEMDPQRLLDKLDARFINGDISEDIYVELKSKYELRLKPDIQEEGEGDPDE